MRTLSICIAFTLGIAVSSCQQEVVENTQVVENETCPITDEVMKDIAAKLSPLMAAQTRTEVQPDCEPLEEEYKEILEPFILDGENLKSQLYAQINATDPQFELTQDDIEWLQCMTEEDFATMSYIMYAMDADLKKNGQVGKCFVAAALGFTNIEEIINIKRLCRAQTALKIFKAIGRRYFFGYVGLAFAAYDFAVCMDYIRPYETTIPEEDIIIIQDPEL